MRPADPQTQKRTPGGQLLLLVAFGYLVAARGAVDTVSTPDTLLSWGTRIRFQRFSVGRLWVHKGKVGGVPGLVRGGAGRTDGTRRAQQLRDLGGRLALLAIVALRMIRRLICVFGFRLFVGVFG